MICRIILLQEIYQKRPITLKLKHITFLTYTAPTLPKAFFKPNVPVKELYLQDLKIYSIEKDAFNCKQFANLQTLEFNRMPIMNFKDGIFNGLTNLKTLILDRVQVYFIGSNILQPLLNLNTVTIQFCGEHTITIDHLFGSTNLYHLNKVSIKYCNLKDTITNRTFTGLRNITELRLDYNEIEQIGPQSFDVPLETLIILSLQWNELKFIPGDLFRTAFGQNTRIYIGHNPWHCDCNMENFRQFMRKDVNIRAIRCKTPSEYEGNFIHSCGNLCNETDELMPISDANELKPAQLTSKSEQELIPVELSKSPIPHRLVHLSKPSNDRQPTIHYGKTKLQIKYKIFDFNLIQFNGKNEILQCKTSIGNDVKGSLVTYNVIPNQLYRFCSMNKLLPKIIPLDCISVFAQLKNEVMNTSNDAWILMKHHILLIVAICMFFILGFIGGLFIAVILAKLFPKFIQCQKDTTSIPKQK